MAENTAKSGFDRQLRITLVVLMVVYVFNILDRQIVNILAEPISQDLGLSDTQIGMMTGIAFALFYTFFGLPIARFADRPATNRVKLISMALLLWSGMTAIAGLAQNFVQLLLARIGVGIGEAGCTPAAHSLIADLAPTEKRASAISFYSLGIPIGGLLGMVLGGVIADAYGWRMALFLVGLPGVILAFFVLAVLKDPRTSEMLKKHEVKDRASVAKTSTIEVFREVLNSKAFIYVTVAGSLAAFQSYGMATWNAIFFQRSHGLTPGEVGLYLGISGGLAAALGTWTGGWLADRFGATNRQHVLTAPAIGMLISVPFAIAAFWVNLWWAAVLLITARNFLDAINSGPTFSCAQGLVKPQSRATAAALLLFSQNLIGLGLGPLFFGILSDIIKPNFGVESVRYVLLIAALIGILPAFFYWRASLRLNAELDRHLR